MPPLSLLSWLLSAAPLALLIALMVWKKQPASRAAPIILSVSALIALTYFRCGIPLLASEWAKGLWNAAAILLVVFFAILLYEISQGAGAFQSMQQGLRRLTDHELLLILILGWVFPSFLQGITGFGVAVAVGAPLLVGIGVKPLWAVVSVLLAHSWGGTFGTLALAWQALLEQAGASPDLGSRAAFAACCLLWIVNFTGGLCVCWFYGRDRGIREGLPAVCCISLVHGGGELLTAQLNDTLACFLPAALGLLAALALCRMGRFRRSWHLAGSPMMAPRPDSAPPSRNAMSFSRSFSPYCFLTAVALLSLLLPPLHRILSRVSIAPSFAGGVTGWGYETPAVAAFSPFQPFTHPSFFLLLSCIFACVVFRRGGYLTSKAMSGAWTRTVKKTVPSGISVICFILISKSMGASGQVEILAQSFVRVFGQVYICLAPLMGLLGSFITSSNMASNILLGKFQLTTASLLGQSAAVFLGAQTAGGAIGNAICPGNVILGCATTNQAGSEGEILKRVLPVTVGTALVCGAATLLLTALA